MKRQFVSSITLTNFQKHRKLHLDLSPGINVLVGESNRGKSSVNRAFGRLCSNSPTGNTCVRFGKTKAHVEVTLTCGDDARVVRYTKSKTNGTSYSVDQSHYKRCGRGVPEEVRDHLRINPEINIQPQHKQFFLLDGRSPQERAKQLARGTNIDIIGYVVAEARKQCHHFESLHKAKASEASEASAELKRYEPLERAERLTRLARASFSSMQDALRLHDRLTSLESRLTETLHAEQILQEIPDCNKLVSSYENLQELKVFLGKLKEYQTILASEEHDLSRFSFLRELGKENNLITRRDALVVLEEKYTHLQKAERVKVEVVATYRKQLGKVCITCGRPL